MKAYTSNLSMCKIHMLHRQN